MRNVTIAVLGALLLAAVAFATSTTPFVSEAFKLPFTYVHWDDASKKWVITTTEPDDGAYDARAQYNRSNVDLGWDYLMVEGDPYAAGYLEGYLTAPMIALEGLTAMPSGQVGEWITEHVAYLEESSKRLGGTDKQWRKIGELIAFMRGIAEGATLAGFNMTYLDVFLINFSAEIGDVQVHVQVMNGENPKRVFKPSHCSALVKVTPTDLFMAHDTWSGFQGMAYRIHKVYKLRGDPVVVFSAHPAFIASMDDWYMTSNQLAIQETTNMVMNNSLYTAVVPRTISEFLRTMSATLLARNGEEWTTYFARENSGTYNNQYMVVDFKVYAPGSGVMKDTLWIAEQLPGVVRRGDVSDVLASTGYWASYNIPYFKDIYDLSGYEVQKDIFGDFYSYTKYARPEIFKRNQATIETKEDMMHMMRFNKYQTDPFSVIHNCTGAPDNKCLTPQTAMLSIASRGDLMPTYNATGMMDHYGPLSFFMAQGCFGAIDSKIAAYSNRHSLTSWVISGPTNDNQPTFQWNTGACAGSAAPAQSATTVDYPWVEFRVSNE